MTWIVGVNSIFGHSILASDICVTFKSPSGQFKYLDCLQKIHPLGQFVIGGFAGSVRLGFTMLEFLYRQFIRAPSDTSWSLDVISHDWWPRCARRIYKSCPSLERDLGCEIILASVHPTINNGDAPWPRPDLYTYTAPKFEPVRAPLKGTVGIGSGARVVEAMQTLRESFDDFTFHQLITMGGGATQAKVVAMQLEEEIKKHSVHGVSEFIQIGLVTRGQMSIHDHEYDIYPKDSEKVEVRFPPIARNYVDFCRMIAKQGVSAEAAVA